MASGSDMMFDSEEREVEAPERRHVQTAVRSRVAQVNVRRCIVM